MSSFISRWIKCLDYYATGFFTSNVSTNTWDYIMVSMSRCLFTDISVASLSFASWQMEERKVLRGKMITQMLCILMSRVQTLYTQNVFYPSHPLEKRNQVIYSLDQMKPLPGVLCQGWEARTPSLIFYVGQVKFHWIVRTLFSLYPLQMPCSVYLVGSHAESLEQITLCTNNVIADLMCSQYQAQDPKHLNAS